MQNLQKKNELWQINEGGPTLNNEMIARAKAWVQLVSFVTGQTVAETAFDTMQRRSLQLRTLNLPAADLLM